MQLKTIGVITGAVIAAFASSAFARGAENAPHTSQDQLQSQRALNATQRATTPVITWWVLQQQQLAISAEVNNYPCAPILNGHRTPLTMPFYVAARIQQALGLPVDGACGPRTSAAITRAAQSGRIGFTILEGQLVIVQGTGEVIRSNAHVRFSIR